MPRLFVVALFLAQSAMSATEPDGAALRPGVYALLKDGSYIEGTFRKFDGGVYTVEVDGKPRAISEGDVRSIAFPPPPLPKRRPLTRSFQELIGELRKDPYGEKNHAAIEEYASQGEEGLAILLEAVRKDSGQLSGVAGKVFRRMGHEVLPMLVRIARQEQDANVRAAIRNALGEFAMDALPQIRELMTDRDVKLREMALYLLYNRSVKSGTILPPALEPTLITALRDESDTVRSNAAHIVGRMAHGSERIVPP